MSENKKNIMNQEKNNQKNSNHTSDSNVGAAKATSMSVYGAKKISNKFARKRGFKSERKDEFEQRILDIARVTRVMAGGKRMRFRACVAIGDQKGKVGIGLGKGADVTTAVNKAVNIAKKNIVNVAIVNDTIPHDIYQKFGAAKILFKPAKKGRGVIAGGVVRVIVELSGIKNITSKILGTNNKVNNSKCTIEAMKMLKKVDNKKIDKPKEENKEEIIKSNLK